MDEWRERETMQNRRERWERVVEWPLAIIALVFLVAYAVPIVQPGVAASVKNLCSAIIWLSWVAFAVDYFVRLLLSTRRVQFVKNNLLDLAVVALPVLRPLRFVRLLALFSVFSRTSQRELRGKVAFYAGGAATILVIVGALAVTDAERGADGSQIRNVGDGVWWALTTMTTVGYGDRVPVTDLGRVIAAALMIAGVALLGVVTATLASWLVERVSEETEAEEVVTRNQVELLRVEIASLREEIGLLSQNLEASRGQSPLRENHREVSE